MANMGLALSQMHRFDEALAIEQRALGVREKLFEPSHDAVLSSRADVADVLLAMHRWDDVVTAATESIAILQQARGTGAEEAAIHFGHLGTALVHLGRPARRSRSSSERCSK